ncbi:hypothetical protein M911_04240 [Ectothiorhodospira haloalkaliphila]|uniref:Uncharacterized protein n=1 Tax=Ectothiorhodospira haloalkaliphila TaxID=421628 RepID=W8KSH1_9GAMM|nr:hypothetical protein M911_04240 [Ectothiorhodospira haloalkaliphila]
MLEHIAEADTVEKLEALLPPLERAVAGGFEGGLIPIPQGGRFMGAYPLSDVSRQASSHEC